MFFEVEMPSDLLRYVADDMSPSFKFKVALAAERIKSSLPRHSPDFMVSVGLAREHLTLFGLSMHLNRPLPAFSGMPS